MKEGSGKLIVILCTERSGSTLLTMMLGGHRSIIAPPEVHLFRYPDFESWQRGYPKAMASLAWILENLGEPANLTDLSARYKGQDPVSIYSDLLRICGSNRFLVDKTPAYARETKVLQRIEQLQPYYFWLVRHPLGVAASLMQRRKQSLLERRRTTRGVLKRARLEWQQLRNSFGDMTGINLKEHLQSWNNTHSRIGEFLSDIPSHRQLRIHYEVLARNPEQEMQRICGCLGIELEAAMLQPQANVPKALTWDLGDEKVIQYHGVNSALAENWRQRFDEGVLDARTRDMMIRLA